MSIKIKNSAKTSLPEPWNRWQIAAGGIKVGKFADVDDKSAARRLFRAIISGGNRSAMRRIKNSKRYRVWKIAKVVKRVKKVSRVTKRKR